MPDSYEATGLYSSEDDSEQLFGDIEAVDLEALAEAILAMLKRELRQENQRRGAPTRA